MAKKQSPTFEDVESLEWQTDTAELTVLDSKALVDYLEQVHGIKAASVAWSTTDLGNPGPSPPPPDSPAKNSGPGRAQLVKVVGQVRALQGLKAGDPSAHRPRSTERAVESIWSLLVNHLGSALAAQAWLDSTNTGYSGSAMDAIREGDADLVLEDLCRQWGPSPSYA